MNRFPTQNVHGSNPGTPDGSVYSLYNQRPPPTLPINTPGGPPVPFLPPQMMGIQPPVLPPVPHFRPGCTPPAVTPATIAAVGPPARGPQHEGFPQQPPNDMSYTAVGPPQPGSLQSPANSMQAPSLSPVPPRPSPSQDIPVPNAAMRVGSPSDLPPSIHASMSAFGHPFPPQAHPVSASSTPPGSSLLPPQALQPPAAVLNPQSRMHVQGHAALTPPIEDDYAWVEQWLATLSRKSANHQTDNSPKLTIAEASAALSHYQTMSTEVLDELAELQRLVTHGNTSDWDAQLSMVSQSCQDLSSHLDEFSETQLTKLVTAVEQRQRKRQKVKHKRRIKWEQNHGSAATERRNELHKRIDEWQARRIASDISQKHEASLRNEAGGTLGEVRKKQQDVSQSQTLLDVLCDLHNERNTVLQREGVDIPSDAEENFCKEVASLRGLLSCQDSAYAEEERLLKVMLEEGKVEEVHRQMEKAKQSAEVRKEEEKAQKSQEDIKVEPAEMAVYKSFYSQASNGVDQLLNVRQQWDVFASSDSTGEGSTIPQSWPSPLRDASELWKDLMSP